jgi:glutamate synthase domain-containing protein 1
MCGIAGFWDKTEDQSTPAGATIVRMLTALGCRGPDSAGVALYGPRSGDHLIVRVSLGQGNDRKEREAKIVREVERFVTVRNVDVRGEYLRLVTDGCSDPGRLARAIEASGPDIEVVSMGSRLEIIKQVGSPQDLDRDYCVSRLPGSHGLGHTRLSTESRVDLSHSQPFWAFGFPDLAIVHNGHITNYHQLRRRYEQRGVKLHTENDSEIVAVYLGDCLHQGLTLADALQAALHDLDGSYSCLAATSNAMGFVKDPFALKPLLVTETDSFAAVATEEVAMRAGLPGDYEVREAQSREVRVWQR